MHPNDPTRFAHRARALSTADEKAKQLLVRIVEERVESDAARFLEQATDSADMKTTGAVTASLSASNISVRFGLKTVAAKLKQAPHREEIALKLAEDADKALLAVYSIPSVYR